MRRKLRPFIRPPKLCRRASRPTLGLRRAWSTSRPAPFPYHGRLPGSNRPFLSAGEPSYRGHVNFRGRVFWVSEKYVQRRPRIASRSSGFDPILAVIVVYFHGHGANLAVMCVTASRCRRRSQRRELMRYWWRRSLPSMPPILAPASSGSPTDSKRFLDELAVKLARLYGDPRSAGGIRQHADRDRRLDSGFGRPCPYWNGWRQVARPRSGPADVSTPGSTGSDWIADTDCTFFVKLYTPHTAHRNADLERRPRERSVPYGSELRHNHLQGIGRLARW